MQMCHLMFAACQKASFPLGNILLLFLIISKPVQTANYKVSLENQIIFSKFSLHKASQHEENF